MTEQHDYRNCGGCDDATDGAAYAADQLRADLAPYAGRMERLSSDPLPVGWKPVTVTLSDAEAQAIQYAYATLGANLGSIRPDIRPTLTDAVARIAQARRYAPLTLTDAGMTDR